MGNTCSSVALQLWTDGYISANRFLSQVLKSLLNHAKFLTLTIARCEI